MLSRVFSQTTKMWSSRSLSFRAFRDRLASFPDALSCRLQGSSNIRFFSSKRKGKRLKRKPSHSALSLKPKPQREPAAVATPTYSNYLLRLATFYRHGEPIQKEHLQAIATRLPPLLFLCLLFSWDESTPWTILRIHGPSMLPTMQADGTELWLRYTERWRSLLSFVQSSHQYKPGDIVGFAHPSQPQHVSCKRIIGVAGDRVLRYGQYVHLYIEQDPEHLGQTWPNDGDEQYRWIDRSTAWDTEGRQSLDRKIESRRTIVVPDGHVWLEADCPGLGIDSRQCGPIPVEWLRGKIIARLWPIGDRDGNKKSRAMFRSRPHPIPLDEATLEQYNVRILPPES